MKMLRLWFWSLGVGVWLAGLAPLLGATPAPQATNASDLWGSEGERWTPRSRLPDFSFAGYHAGEKPIPDVAVKSSIKGLLRRPCVRWAAVSAQAMKALVSQAPRP